MLTIVSACIVALSLPFVSARIRVGLIWSVNIFLKNLSSSGPSSAAVSSIYLKGKPGGPFCFCADLITVLTIVSAWKSVSCLPFLAA